MKKKRRVTACIIILFVILFSLFVILKKKEYSIKIIAIDDYSTDVNVIVLENGKEFHNYNYIKYNDGSNTILCYEKNSVVNKFEIDSDSWIIVLKNGKEKEAKIVEKD